MLYDIIIRKGILNGFLSKLSMILYFFWDESVNYEDNKADEEIVNDVINGDKEKFYIIIEKWQPKIQRYVYYHFNFDKETAGEVTQEIFLHLWNKLEKFDDKYYFSSWLYRLAYNFCVDWLRKNKQQNNVWSLEDFENNIKEDFESKEFENEYKRKLLEMLLTQLDYKYKNVIILYYFEEKSYDEISEIMDISKSSVGTLLTRSKGKLKEIIEKNSRLSDALELDL